MKKFAILILSISLCIPPVVGQNEDSKFDSPLGLRIKRNGNDYLIYADSGLVPQFGDYRKLNYQVYFRKIEHPLIEIKGKEYQLITIPGSRKVQPQSRGIVKKIGEKKYPRAGKLVSKEDYDQNFWIDVEIIEKYAEAEFYKFANDVFSGLLTAPFKYRLKLGNAPVGLIDGDFNIGPFIGWKWRISSSQPFYVAPFGFAGITTLQFNSGNNKNLSDPEILENGTGLTYGAGISFRFGSVSPGFIIGWDKGFGDLGSGFLYNDKAWISFSVNYDFFKPPKDSEGNQ